MASIRDVAKMAGVSVGTVSRYLNGQQLKEKNMKKIAEAISALDYKENIIAKGLKNNRSFSIGLLINGISSRFGSEVVSGIERVAEENGYSLLLSGFADQPEKIEQKIEYLMKHVIDGLIVFLSEEEWSGFEMLTKMSIPVIALNCPEGPAGIDTILVNDRESVAKVIAHHGEQGHKKIGFIGGSDRNIDTGKPSMDIREWSFRQSVAYYHCLEEEYILISEKFTVDEGYRMGKELLKKSSLPTALCIASDTLAVGVLQALNEKGIQVPEQMALFSINDVNIAKYLSPPLTTIHIDIPCICETALDLLRNRVLYGGKVTKLIFVNGIPIFRKSC